MQLTVKTLKSEKFVVEAEPSNTVAQVKTIIVSVYVLLLKPRDGGPLMVH